MKGLNAQAYLEIDIDSLDYFDLMNGIYFLATDGAPVISSL